jgi:rRNA maturation endonuclease Nob1
VALAIPFILLNNGDTLESLKGNMGNSSASNLANTSGRKIVGNKFQKKCTRCKKEVDEDYSGCPHCGNNTFE